jgi:hypothetical protein
MKIQSYKDKQENGKDLNIKNPANSEVFYNLNSDNNYLPCLAYLVLNLSIRPAVSISLDLPV